VADLDGQNKSFSEELPGAGMTAPEGRRLDDSAGVLIGVDVRGGHVGLDLVKKGLGLEGLVQEELQDVGFAEGGALDVALAATIGNLRIPENGRGIVRQVEFPAFGWLGLGFHFVKKGAEQD
jgi:hypothetical protein